jgi:hypothetical protein
MFLADTATEYGEATRVPVVVGIVRLNRDLDRLTVSSGRHRQRPRGQAIVAVVSRAIELDLSFELLARLETVDEHDTISRGTWIGH